MRSNGTQAGMDKEPEFRGFGCSECQWLFKPTSPLIGKSLDQMKQAYEAERDKRFAAHVCAKFPKANNPNK
ncbi:MAG: hypothetical protein WBR26_16265 [Candidatus Acidiferrum sp.]